MKLGIKEMLHEHQYESLLRHTAMKTIKRLQNDGTIDDDLEFDNNSSPLGFLMENPCLYEEHMACLVEYIHEMLSDPKELAKMQKFFYGATENFFSELN